MLKRIWSKFWSSAAKPQVKSYLRALAVIGVGAILHSVKVPTQYAVIVAAATAPLLHWLDPTDKSVGFGSKP